MKETVGDAVKVKAAGGIIALESGPFAFFHSAPDQVLVSGTGAVRFFQRNHEVCAVRLILIYLNAQHVQVVRHQFKSPPRRMPVGRPAFRPQRRLGGMVYL